MEGSTCRPYLYQGETGNSRVPVATFDPRAATRATWEAKKHETKLERPLILFNLHSNAQTVLEHRTRPFRPMGVCTKRWIKRSRVVQLVLRIIEVLAAVGLLVLSILITKMDTLTGWVVRLTCAVLALHTAYAVLHLSRHATGRSPGSLAAYHTFAAIIDLAALSLLGYGMLSARNYGGQWGVLIPGADPSLLSRIFLPALYYGFLGTSGLLIVSLVLCLFLGVSFRRISLMPPDANPLDDHLTTRHPANQQRSWRRDQRTSIATAVTSDVRVEEVKRPAVPFALTRQGSDLPSSQSIQRPVRSCDLSKPLQPSNEARASDASDAMHDFSAETRHCLSMDIPRPNRSESSHFVSVEADDAAVSMLSFSGKVASGRASLVDGPVFSAASVQLESGRIEATDKVGVKNKPSPIKTPNGWFALNSLFGQKARPGLEGSAVAGRRQAYKALTQAYDAGEDDTERHTRASYDSECDLGESSMPHLRPLYPNPLHSNPSVRGSENNPPLPPAHGPSFWNHAQQQQEQLRRAVSALSEISLNDRRVSGGDGPDPATQAVRITTVGGKFSTLRSSLKFARHNSHKQQQRRQRNSSIQPDNAFSTFVETKPYGHFVAGTPPLMESTLDKKKATANNMLSFVFGEAGDKRVLSSGNDWHAPQQQQGDDAATINRRRNASGNTDVDAAVGLGMKMGVDDVLDEDEATRTSKCGRHGDDHDGEHFG